MENFIEKQLKGQDDRSILGVFQKEPISNLIPSNVCWEVTNLMRRSTDFYEVGMGYWLFRDGNYDMSYDESDCRRFFILGKVIFCTTEQLVVEYKDMSSNPEKVLTKEVSFPRGDVLEDPIAIMRCIDWETFVKEKRFLCNSLREVRVRNEGDNPYNYSRFLKFGEHVDFFISHAWGDDDGQLKMDVLSDLANKFKARKGRFPTFWIDRFCIDESNIENCIVHIPFFIGACRRMIVLSSETYFTKRMCVYELFLVYLGSLAKPESKRRANAFEKHVLFLPIDKTHGDVVTIDNLIDFSFNDTKCFDPNQSNLLDRLFMAGGINIFEQELRDHANTLVKFLTNLPGRLTTRAAVTNKQLKERFKFNRLRSKLETQDADARNKKEKNKSEFNGDKEKRTHVFLTHNWSNDKKGRNNHERVSQINEALKSRGIVTWFDNDRMKGDIRDAMTSGIDNTMCVLVFITSTYRNKVNNGEGRDNCKYEFGYAFEQIGPSKMIPIVMEDVMKEQREWKGALGGGLGSRLYIDGFDVDFVVPSAAFDATVDKLVQEIEKVLGSIPRLV